MNENETKDPSSPKRRRVCSESNESKKLEDFTLNEIETLKRKQLQSLCKSHKIKANSKNIILIQKLKDKWTEISQQNTIIIDNIISDDLIQYILLFIPLCSMNSICSKWNKLSQNNFNQYLNNKYNKIQLQNKNKSNTIWIIHPTRNKLTQSELNRGFNGPINNLYDAWNKSKSNDICLIHNGAYVIHKNIGSQSPFFGINWWDKNLSLIGIGNNVNIYNIKGNWEETALYFENIIFSIPLLAQNKSILSLKNCQFPKGNVIIGNGASAMIENCWFIAKKASYSAIEIEPTAKNVEIVNCDFENFGYSGINYDYESMIIDGEFSCIMIVKRPGINNNNERIHFDELVQVKIINNIFKNNLCYPICERHPITDYRGRPHIQRDTKWIYNKSEKYLVQNNILSGFNGTAMGKKENDLIIDANTIYFDGQPEGVKCFT